jgi:hypothetical protein
MKKKIGKKILLIWRIGKETSEVINKMMEKPT